MASREDLLGLTRAEFAFLQDIPGCEVDVNEPNAFLTTVAYKLTEIAVELQFDWRDLDVACYISELSEGHLPDGYLVSDGKRIRFRLGDLTTEVLARFRRLPSPPKRRPPLDQWAEQQSNRMAAAVRIYADVLRSDFSAVRSRAEAGFNASE